ncbi:hypothetical protein [Spirosoma sordidisoli]|uniref:Uncharacterized protein n=1 Tax=Spirosoma sordidisoli TaxID=2502893 RepID=A0A4V1RVC9_9BACT|nr:hypothetical protein [Spirosoma sordidisoli]RYC66328.1 hypothetical protein EQG79_30095 [Spirosoma sordidisoli]
MRIVQFNEANRVLSAPPSSPEVQPLPVFTDGDVCISCWEPSPEELATINQTGRIWLMVVSGQTQPPVAVMADFPFMAEADFIKLLERQAAGESLTEPELLAVENYHRTLQARAAQDAADTADVDTADVDTPDTDTPDVIDPEHPERAFE